MDLSRASSPTQITIRPEVAPGVERADWRDQPFTRRHLADRTRTPETAQAGSEGLSVSDVVEVLNPLQHLPFVSTLYGEMTGQTISPAAKIIGGAILGGPIGLIASVFEAIFTQETGKTVAGTAYAALTGDEIGGADTAPRQTAYAPPQGLEEAVAGVAAPERIVTADILPPEGSAGKAASMSAAQASAVMGLYGGSASPALRAYQQANMLGYLQAPMVNRVL